MDLRMKYEKRDEYWLKQSENWVKQVSFMPFWTKLYFSWLRTVIIHSRVCQIYLSRQSNVLTIILNLAITQWALNHISHPSQKWPTNILSIVTTKAFSISISSISLCSLLPPFTLHQFNGFHLFSLKLY